MKADADGNDEYEPRGSLNLRWNDDGTLACIHDDTVKCDLPNHMTVPTFVRSADLRWPTHAPPTWDTGRTAVAEYDAERTESHD